MNGYLRKCVDCVIIKLKITQARLSDFLLQRVEYGGSEEFGKRDLQSVTEFFDDIDSNFAAVRVEHAVDRGRRHARAVGEFVRSHMLGGHQLRESRDNGFFDRHCNHLCEQNNE